MRIFLLNLLCITSVLTECGPPDPIVLDILLDVNIKEHEQLQQITTDVISSLADGSSVFINSVGMVGYRIAEIATMNIPYSDLDWSAKLQAFDMVQSGHTIESSLIEEEINKRFSVNDYKKRAELLLLFVSDKTKLDTVSTDITTTKTLVVVFGTSIPAVYQDLASGDDHFYLVGSKDHLIDVTQSLVNQTFCDSHYYCDTDKYRPKRGYKCRSCFNVCAEGQIKRTETCAFRCPFFRVYVPKISSTETTSTAEERYPVNSATEDHKELINMLIITFLVVVIFITIMCVLLYKKHMKIVATPSSSSESITMTPMLVIPTCSPVEETQVPGIPISLEEQQSFIDVSDKVTDCDHQSNSDHSLDTMDNDTAGFSIPFKNNQELEANGHCFDAPLQRVHEAAYADA